MDLDYIFQRVSRAQLLSIVDSANRKIALWYGSVSAGKTVASLIAFLIAVRLAPRKGLIIIVGKTLATIYANVFVLLQDREIFGARIAAQVLYTPGATSAVILGREVLLIGANNAESVGKIQGKTVVLAYVDEAVLLPEAFWNMLVSRLRVDGARLLATMNPASMNHWMRKEWILKAADKNLIHFHFTMRDNPHLPAGYEADMQKAYSGVFYDRMIKGEWTNAAGAVYPMWDPARHIIPFAQMPKIKQVLGDGIDFGVSNASAALRVGITAERKPRLVLMDEWRYDPRDHHGATLAPSDQAAMYREWNKLPHTPYESFHRPDYNIVDPAALAFTAELRKFDEMELQPAHNGVLQGIGTVSRLLKNDQLIVTDRCKGWNTEVTEYRWDPKATAEGEDAVEKSDDHSLDAGRYGIHTTRQNWQYELEAA
jgi:PBSX family phage terminase large subunit